MEKIVIASGNAGKLREIAGILAPLDIRALPQSAFDVPDCPEPHLSFVENALAKARHASRHSGLPALADDSGLCVEALGGAPGVHSAYYAGRDGDRATRDARNNEKLLLELKGQVDRRARYVCVLVLARGPGDGDPLIAQAEWHGEIAAAPRGANGFGYDPYFHLPALGKTAAELSPGEKNRLSHRGQALQKLLELIRAL